MIGISGALVDTSGAGVGISGALVDASGAGVGISGALVVTSELQILLFGSAKIAFLRSESSFDVFSKISFFSEVS